MHDKKYKYNRDTKELIEEVFGDELVNGKGDKLNGEYYNRVKYSEDATRECIRTYENQLQELNDKIKGQELLLTDARKGATPVDRAFRMQFEQCMQDMQKGTSQQAIEQLKKTRVLVQEEYDKIKKVMEE